MPIAEYINHFGIVRVRVTGLGNFKMTLYSLDDVRSLDLQDTVLEVTTDRQPTRLCNFKSMNARLKFSVTEIDEYFELDGMLIYVKPTETSYPQ